jgi:hypothetical protein
MLTPDPQTLDAFLAAHRAIFGAARMEDAGSGGDAGNGDSSGGGGDAGQGDAGQGPDGELGETGEAALRAERKRAAEAERRAKAAERERDQLRASQLSESERAVEQAKRDASEATRTELLGTVGRRLTESAVLAYATGKLADPTDAVALAELDGITVDAEDLTVDQAAVRKAVDELLKRKPHLAAGKRSPGSADQGPRGGAADPASDAFPVTGAGRIAAAYAQQRP